MQHNKIKKPVIIISCPRSGSSLLFRLLSESSQLLSLYQESHFIFNQFYLRKLQRDRKEYDDDLLTQEDITSDDKKFLLQKFHHHLARYQPLKQQFLHTTKLNHYSHYLHLYYRTCQERIDKYLAPHYRMVEKTPRNCFRIAFIEQLFPDARYIFLIRDGRATISSIIEGWQRNTRYVDRNTTRQPRLNINGITEQKWCFVKPPGWQAYTSKTVEEVAAFQWLSANTIALDKLQQLDQQRIYRVRYEDLIGNTEATVKGLCQFIQVPYCSRIERFSNTLPIIKNIHGDAPQPTKWKKHEALLESIYPKIKPTMIKLGYRL